MATLLYIGVRLLALVGVILYAIEAGEIWFGVSFSCFGPCQPYPGSPDPIYSNLTQSLAQAPGVLIPAGVTLAITLVACLTLLLRAGRWGWAFLASLALLPTTGLFLVAAFRLPGGLPHVSQFAYWEAYYADWESYVQSVEAAYLVSLLGPLALLVAAFATPSPPPEPPPYLVARSS